MPVHPVDVESEAVISGYLGAPPVCPGILNATIPGEFR
jgi:hypothetical protein